MTLGQASILLWEEGLLKHFVTAQALSLLFTSTHDLLFLRETTTASSCLKTAACTQHCHVTQMCSHTTYIWAQSKTKSSSMCCYMNLSDDILFLAGIKLSRACYLLGLSLFPSPANQQGSVELASLFFDQTTKSPDQSQSVQRLLLTGVTPEGAG